MLTIDHLPAFWSPLHTRIQKAIRSMDHHDWWKCIEEGKFRFICSEDDGRSFLGFSRNHHDWHEKERKTITGDYYATLLDSLKDKLKEKCPKMTRKKFSSIKTHIDRRNHKIAWFRLKIASSTIIFHGLSPVQVVPVPEIFDGMEKSGQPSVYPSKETMLNNQIIFFPKNVFHFSNYPCSNTFHDNKIATAVTRELIGSRMLCNILVKTLYFQTRFAEKIFPHIPFINDNYLCLPAVPRDPKKSKFSKTRLVLPL